MDALGRVSLGEVVGILLLILFCKRTMNGLVKDGFSIMDLELVFKSSGIMGEAAAV